MLCTFSQAPRGVAIVGGVKALRYEGCGKDQEEFLDECAWDLDMTSCGGSRPVVDDQ